MISYEDICDGMKDVQDLICEFLVSSTGESFKEDLWSYDRGGGGGRTRVWENESPSAVLEKAGVNYSAITGTGLPSSAAEQFRVPSGREYRACGVSLVLHPRSPHIPTIHANIRFFECGDLWWFGGGIDLTPYYLPERFVRAFHRTLRGVCEKHSRDYSALKKECDEYFTIKHRSEMRGVGGIFFDRVGGGEPADGRALHWDFVRDVGRAVVECYRPLLLRVEPAARDEISEAQREFQLIRRGRYVEFNLVYDRGTKFGLQSGGRIESVLMSLPSLATWKYAWEPAAGSEEERITRTYYQPRAWADEPDNE